MGIQRRSFFFQAIHRRNILVTVALGHQPFIIPDRHVAERNFDADFGRHRLADLQILVMQGEPEARFENALRHRQSSLVQKPVAGRAAPDHLDHLVHR